MFIHRNVVSIFIRPRWNDRITIIGVLVRFGQMQIGRIGTVNKKKK